MLLNTLITTLTLGAGLVKAHGLPEDPWSNSPAEIARRQLEANARHIKARDCSSQIDEYQRLRKARRDLRRRGLSTDEPIVLAKRTSDGADAADGSADANGGSGRPIKPHYRKIQNFTCIASPEVEEGPFYLRNEAIRQDLRETQGGVPLYLDVGILDIHTCQPAKKTFLEIWNANSQGLYAGFSLPGALPPEATMPQTAPVPSGFVPPPGNKTDPYNWLRGGYWSDDNGMVELITIYPGFYTGRTAHIHTIVHGNVTTSPNGTIVSTGYGIRHIGQLFFEESLNDEVFGLSQYQGSGQIRTLNVNDHDVPIANAAGFNAYVDIERLGHSIYDGLLGYITIGIDSSAHRSIVTWNYWDPHFTPSSSATTAPTSTST